MSREAKVLILSKDLRFGGGVVNFVAMLLANFPESVEWEHFRVGEPQSGKGGIWKLVWPLLDNSRLFFRLINGNIECIHLNPSMNWNAFMRDVLLIMTARAVLFKKFVIFFHGWDERFLDRVRENPVYGFLLRRMYGRNSIIIVLANRFKEQLVDIGINENCIRVSTTMFDGAMFEGLTRSDDHEPEKKERIIFLSRFVLEKGVLELLEAFGQVLKRFPNAELVFAGDGPARDAMEEYVRDNGLSESVIFAGYLRDREKAKMLLKSDLFVLPTRYPEGCPVAILEAMAAGVPVITTPVGGMADIFVDEENGILLTSINPKDIGDAISKLLGNKAWRCQIGENNRLIAWQNYEAKIVSKWISSHYNEITGRNI